MRFKHLVIASHNPGKLREYKGLFDKFGVEVASAGDLNLPEPEETGTTFQENAELKAKYVGDLTKSVSLGDDGGLVIPALGGHPGIKSARWAKEIGGFKQAHLALEKMLEGKSKDAYFHLVLALYDPDTEITQYFEGKCPGKLSFPARGDEGFGYDPIFIPEGYEQTFAELGVEVKKQVSHRARALKALTEGVF